MTIEQGRPAQRGSRIDGSKTIFWGVKRRAIAAAKAIGWRASDVREIHTRFQIGWAIHQPVIGGWMTRERYAELLATRVPKGEA